MEKLKRKVEREKAEAEKLTGKPSPAEVWDHQRVSLTFIYRFNFALSELKVAISLICYDLTPRGSLSCNLMFRIDTRFFNLERRMSKYRQKT